MRLLHHGEAGKNANLAWFHRIAPGKGGAPVLVLCGSLLVSHDGATVAREETPRMAGHRKAPRKVAGDLLVSGRAWPNAAEYGHERAVRIAVEQGRWRKELAVFGDRLWHIGVLGASITEPVPFSSIPVIYERAFGGTGYTPNPVGRGMGEGTQGDLLPNIEYPDHQVQLRTHRPPPAGFGPIPASCNPRAERLGTYDAAWLVQDWPGMPQDFDPRFWNEAPADQQFPEFFKGDERFTVLNMHQEKKRAELSLPGKKLRAFLQRQDGAFAEMPLALDTVDIDMEAGRTELVWRGAAAVKSPRLRDIKFLFTAIEPLAAPVPLETYRAQFEARRRATYPTREEAQADREEAEAKRQKEADAAKAKLEASLKEAQDITKAANAFAAGQAAKAGKYPPAKHQPAQRDAMALLAAHDPEKAALLNTKLASAAESIKAAQGEKGPVWTRERVAEAHAQGASMAGVDLSG
ncbi:MAG TPA: DUF2169 domain-containing protein, partial [Acidocella sp.]|nr:DUF2169 domain-containing protein [Acidocella sp.]